MSDQPEALMLADALDELDQQFSQTGLCGEAATELRRLHEENERLRGIVPEVLEQLNDDLCEENKELRHATGVANQTIAAVVAQRDELLVALKSIMDTVEFYARGQLTPTENSPVGKAIAAIKKAEGL
jgi:hypothetical protein